MFTQGHKQITVRRTDLLAKLRANKIVHDTDYQEALEGYKIKLQQDLRAMLTDVLAASPEEVPRINTVKFDPPQNRSKDYEKAIAMVDMTATETIEIDDTLFSAYVLNDWSWSSSFNQTTTLYKSIRASALGAAG